jgi:hypothetical protein
MINYSVVTHLCSGVNIIILIIATKKTAVPILDPLVPETCDFPLLRPIGFF